MSRAIAPLSEAACRSAKPTDRAYKRFNGDGLSMEQLITSQLPSQKQLAPGPSEPEGDELNQQISQPPP